MVTTDDRATTLRRVAAEHGVSIEVPDTIPGPTVTAYGVTPAPGVAPAAVGKLADSWSLALGAPVRYVGPVGGRLVVEVPNAERRPVTLSDVMPDAQVRPDVYALQVPLGVKAGGGVLNVLLDALPHLLVAGATGSGKSVYVNAVLVALLRQAGPDRLALMLADPKRVELAPYANLPHLLRPIAVEPLDIVDMLRAAVAEMEARYALMSAAGVRHVRNLEAPPARLVVVVDELADVMLTRQRKEAERLIQALTQKARAAGIHLVLATQRPSVDVVTGIIKANVPTRIAFAVSTMTDSRVVLDANGAESLVGLGDGLAMLAGRRGLVRFQAPNMTDDEIAAAVAAWVVEREPEPAAQGEADEAQAVDLTPHVEQHTAAAREPVRHVAAPPPPPCNHTIHDILAAELTENTRRSAAELDARLTALTAAVAAMAEAMAHHGLTLPDEAKEALT